MQTASGRNSRFHVLPAVFAAALALPFYLAPGPARAAGVQLAQAQAPAANSGGSDGSTLPMPAPLVDQSKEGQKAAAPQETKPAEILMDISKAPEPVQKMRQAIMDAAASGDLKKVVALMKQGAEPTDIGPDDTGHDPETALKEMSGDGDGLEILSIMLDILSTGYAHVDAGTADEAYVWPYFTEKRLDQLTAAEKVDLMRIVTAGDFADMLEYGGYNFYRIGISPDGHWKFFLSGN